MNTIAVLAHLLQSRCTRLHRVECLNIIVLSDRDVAVQWTLKDTLRSTMQGKRSSTL